MPDEVVQAEKGPFVVVPLAEIKLLRHLLGQSNLQDTPVLSSLLDALGPQEGKAVDQSILKQLSGSEILDSKILPSSAWQKPIPPTINALVLPH